MNSDALATQLFFIEEKPTDPRQALELLLSEALPRVPEIIHDKLLGQFEDLRTAWRSKVLLEGEEEVRSKALPYLVGLSNRPKFGHFEISGIPFQACAQLNAAYVDAHGSVMSVSPFRVWRCEDRTFGCGNSLLED